VEPNEAMRKKAEAALHSYDRFFSMDGTAEATGLAAGSIDLVIASQAFHWFNPLASRKEFRRILRGEGYTALIWNERQIDTPFERAYEDLLLKYAIDYTTVNHKNISEDKIRAFFDPQPFRLRIEGNEQTFDQEGFKGRVLSSSYMPDEYQPAYNDMLKDIDRIFLEHQQQGAVRVNYLTKLYVGVLNYL
jgi:hypothetical protein